MATAEQIAQFKLDNWQHALAVSAKTGIDPRIVMAQSALETGWGTAAPGNNMFGIQGPGQVLPSQEYENGQPVMKNSSFKMYDSAPQSFADYAAHPIIQAAGKAGGYNAQLAALKGYATAPDYSQKVQQIADTLQVPSGVQASTLPDIGGSSTPAPATPDQGLLAQYPAPAGKSIDSEIADWSKYGSSGPSDSAYAGLAGGLTKTGTAMMMAQPARPQLHPVESANEPKPQAQGNPNFVQQLAQARLLRKQGGM